MEGGGSFARAGVVDTSAQKASPVDHAANEPHAMPNPGTNIGRATVTLWVKIPIASIPSTTCWNSLMKFFESCSEMVLALPAEYAAENTAIKISKIMILRFANTPSGFRVNLRVES